MTAVRTISCLLFLLFGVIALPARADSLIVVKSNAQGWPLGTKIDGTTVLTLADGEQLTVISEDGLSMTIAGPYSAAPMPDKLAPRGGRLIDALSSLFSAPSKDETVIGAFRAPDEDREALAWMIDATLLAGESGVVCRDADEGLSFARPGDTEAISALLERIGSASRANLVFPSDAAAVPWPDTIPAEDGAHYRLTTAGDPTPVEFVIAVLPVGLPTPAHRAAWMAERGCDVQARRLILLAY